MAQLESNQCTDRGPTSSGVSAFVNASPSPADGLSAQRPSAGSAAAAALHPASNRPSAARARAAIFTEPVPFASFGGQSAAPTPSRVQYRDDIDKFSTHTIDRDIR